MKTPKTFSGLSMLQTVIKRTQHAITLLHPKRKDSRKGVALVISLLLLFVITGLGIIAMQTASLEQQASSFYRLAKQAHYTSESGLMMSFATASNAGSGFWDGMKRQSTPGSKPEITLNNASFPGMLFTLNKGDSANLDPQVSIRIWDPRDGVRAPGYSGDFCFKRLTFDASGQVGADPSTVRVEDGLLPSAVQTFRAHGLLGPLECEGN